jgi:putative intracellular protease/amidase
MINLARFGHKTKTMPLVIRSGVQAFSTSVSYQNTPKRPLVLVTVSDGSEEIETMTIVDVLRRAGAVVELTKVEDPNVKGTLKETEWHLCKMSRGVTIAADTYL